jgi:hypothetical protein
MSTQRIFHVFIFSEAEKLKSLINSILVLYGCETWSLTLREEHRLRMFENRMLRKICRPKRDEGTGQWRKVHDEELHDLYPSPSRIMKSRRMRWVGHEARMGDKRNSHGLLMGKPEGKNH